MNEYATLDQIRAYVEASSTAMGTGDDDKLLQYLTWASRRIDRYCHGRRFYPRSETRDYDYQADARVHIVDDDLLAVTTLTVDDEAISSDEYFLYPLTGYPKWKIEMNRGGGEIFTFTDTWQQAVQVAATWGWHDDWDNAWADSQDTVEDNPLGSSATTLTLNDVDGSDVNGLTPRISPGNLLKIESEYLAVTATDIDANTATVRRGVNGTTAASHNQNTTVSVYQPPEIVVGACLDLTKWLYEHRNAVGGIIALPALEGAAIRVEVEGILGEWGLPRGRTRLIRFG